MTEENQKETETKGTETQEAPKETQETQTEPDWKAESTKWENLYKGSQREVSKAQEELKRLGKRAEILDNLPDRVDSIEELLAEIADNQAKIAGVEVEQPQPVPSSKVAKLRQEREARKAKTSETPEADMSDPEVKAAVRAYGIVEEMGWDADNPIVQKAWNMNTATEALEFLQKEVRKSKDGEVARLVDEGVKKALKDAGLTAGETTAPSGSSGRSFTAAEIAGMSYEEFKQLEPEIDKARREGRIKK